MLTKSKDFNTADFLMLELITLVNFKVGWCVKGFAEFSTYNLVAPNPTILSPDICQDTKRCINAHDKTNTKKHTHHS